MTIFALLRSYSRAHSSRHRIVLGLLTLGIAWCQPGSAQTPASAAPPVQVAMRRGGQMRGECLGDRLTDFRVAAVRLVAA